MPFFNIAAAWTRCPRQHEKTSSEGPLRKGKKAMFNAGSVMQRTELDEAAVQGSTKIISVPHTGRVRRNIPHWVWTASKTGKKSKMLLELDWVSWWGCEYRRKQQGSKIVSWGRSKVLTQSLWKATPVSNCIAVSTFTLTTVASGFHWGWWEPFSNVH